MTHDPGTDDTAEAISPEIPEPGRPVADPIQVDDEAEPGPGEERAGEERAGQEPGELVLAMSPRQIIGGFALLAGLILMVRRYRRKR